MSDFEMFMSFNATYNLLLAVFTIFIATVFAFLVASLLLATKLTPALAGIALGLFTSVSALLVWIAYNVAVNLGNLVEGINAAVAEGSSTLTWPNFVGPDAPAGIGMMIPALMLLAAIAALIFFFNQRLGGRSGA
jgi:hypothetical protein